MGTKAPVRATINNWFNGTIVTPKLEDAFLIVLHELGITTDASKNEWLKAARRLRRRGSPADSAEPFPGLRSYDSSDAAKFFGRKRLINDVLAELNRLFLLGGGIAVMSGVSGAGKSSALKAGLIPALAEGKLDGSSAWPVLYIQSGPDPLQRLAHEMATRVEARTDDIMVELGNGAAGVQQVLRRLCAPRFDADARLVVIVDQFEEALRAAERNPDDPALARFLDLLTALADGPMLAAVVIGVRSDYLAPAVNRTFSDGATNCRPIMVVPMKDNELKEVIEEPVRGLNVKIDPGFVELLISDVSARNGKAGHEAGTLPLLSHALRVTWEQGEKRALTVENYRAAGGVNGALETSAKTLYESLNSRQRDVARRMFLCLVDVHPTGADTRRQVPIDELHDEVDEGVELEVVLDRFVEQRLITIDEDTVEITHEALMDAWQDLVNWRTDDRVGLLSARRLNSDAREWDGNGRNSSDLYSGTKLEAAKSWRAKTTDGSPELTRLFLAASVRKSKRTARLVKSAIATLSVLLLVAVVSTVAALVTANSLQQQRDEAQSRALASQVSALRGRDIGLARQLALVAYRISPTVEARSALIDATALRPAVRMLGADGSGIMYAVGLHPAGTVAVAATEKAVRFWDVTKPGHPSPLSRPTDSTCLKIYALAFSPNGNLLAASCEGGTIHLWDTHDPMNPVELPTLTGLGEKVYSVSFSPDGRMMAAAIAEKPATSAAPVPGFVRLWRVSGTEPVPVGQMWQVDDNSAAKSVSFHPGNNHLAVGTNDGTVQIWDISTPELPAGPVIATGPTKAIGQLAFSPDGKTLAAGGADFLVHLWSTADPRNPVPAGKPVDGAATWVNAVAFSPDGATLAIASSDATVGVRLLDVATRRITATMPHPIPVTSVKFSADGTTVISGANDGTARLWPVAAPTIEGMDYLVSASKFSPNKKILAVGSSDLRLFDVTDPWHPKPYGPALTNQDKFSGTLAFSPDSRLLAEGRGRSGTVQLWDVSDPARPTSLGPPLKAHAGQVETVSFSADGTMLATGARDGVVNVWNVRTPETPVLLSTPGTFTGNVNEVSFSPNGKLLAAGSVDKTARIWNITNASKPSPVGSPIVPANHYVYSTTFSPDGSMLAISLADSSVRLYDVTDPASPKQIGDPLTGPENYVQSLSFTTDGSTLAAAGNNGTVWIWDIKDRENPAVIATLTLASAAMYPVHFQPDSRVLVAGSGDRKAWLWTTDVAAAEALVCGTSGDSITKAEWRKYVQSRDYSPPC